MENFAPLMHGFGVALTTYHVALMIVGVLLGILVGVLPGLGAPNGVSLLLPLTFTMDPVSAIILLSSMYWGALFGGSTTSILFNIPGRTLIRRDDLRRLSDGKAGTGRRGTDARVPLGRFRCAGGRDPDHGSVGMGCEFRASLQLSGIFRRLFPGLRELRRAWRGISVQDRRFNGPRLCLRGRRHGYDFGRPAPDLWLQRTSLRHQLSHRGDRPVRHRRTPADHGGRACASTASKRASRLATSSGRSPPCRDIGSPSCEAA